MAKKPMPAFIKKQIEKAEENKDGGKGKAAKKAPAAKGKK